MTYVIANPHGAYGQFLDLLDEIEFGEDDVMFVLGDIIDYGEDSIDLLCDLTFRENIWAICGEHDKLAHRMLEGFDRMIKTGETPDADYISDMTEWSANGGKVTLDSFRSLDEDMREGVLDYLADLPGYEIISVGGKDWLLIHSGIKGYKPGTDLEDYDENAFISEEGNEGVLKIGGYTVVCGHLPTTEFFSCDGKINFVDGYYAIDCGASRGGKLACLCLDNGKEYYV